MSAAEEEKPVDAVETFDFGVKKKKKSKKPAPDFDAAPVASSNANDDEPDVEATDETPKEDATGEDVGDMFADLKKKKKKSKKVVAEGAEEDAEEGAAEAAAPTEAFDFGEKKKKKKNKKVDMAEFEAALKDGEDGEEEQEDGGVAAEKEGEDAWLGSNRDYTYGELLHRVFNVLRANNPELGGDKKRYTIAPPQVMREGTKKSVFANVVDICRRMHRQPDHVIQFLFAELGTTGSIDGSQRLIIKGRFQQKQIENVLKRYIMEYVTCKTCKSGDTILTKENRLFFLQCESCGSTRTVSAIKTGFMAQTKDTRKAAKRLAGA